MSIRQRGSSVPPRDRLRAQYRDASNLNARIRLHQQFSVNKQGWLSWVFEQLDLPGPGRVLEIGCGTGSLWSENAPRVPADLDLVLTDFSPGMVSAARDNLRGLEPAFVYAVADAQWLPFADQTCDVIIATHVLFYVPDRTRAFGEIRRVLRPGGRLYASTTGNGHMREIGYLLKRFDAAIDLDRDFSHAATFNLENGASELAGWFPYVELRRYEDALVVTAAEPLVAYIMSMMRVQSQLAAVEQPELLSFVRRELDTNGPIRISKEVGLFIAGAQYPLPERGTNEE